MQNLKNLRHEPTWGSSRMSMLISKGNCVAVARKTYENLGIPQKAINRVMHAWWNGKYKTPVSDNSSNKTELTEYNSGRYKIPSVLLLAVPCAWIGLWCTFINYCFYLTVSLGILVRIQFHPMYTDVNFSYINILYTTNSHTYILQNIPEIFLRRHNYRKKLWL